MDILKKLFPVSFNYASDVAQLIIGILIYIVGGAIAGAVIGFLAQIAIIGWLFGLVGSLLGIYCFAGIVIQVLVFLKVLN